MNEKFNKNAKDEKLTKKLGRGVHLIVIGPLNTVRWKSLNNTTPVEIRSHRVCCKHWYERHCKYLLYIFLR